jgi:transposase
MNFKLHHSIEELKILMKKSSRREIIFRIQMVIMKAKGETIEKIADFLSISKKTIILWLNKYSLEGFSGLKNMLQKGRKRKLTESNVTELKETIKKSNILDNNKKYTNGRMILELIQKIFFKKFSNSGLYNFIKRIGLRKLKPRPVHEKNNPELMKEWQENFPKKIGEIMKKNEDKNLSIYFQDESRYGQMTISTGIWSLKGERPRYKNQASFLNSWIFGAINPNNGKYFGLILPKLDGTNMQIFIDEFSKTVDKNEHVIMVLDGSRAHTTKALNIPENITFHFLPPYSPQLNPIERLWGYLKRNYLSFKRYNNIEELIQAGSDAWGNINSEIVKSISKLKLNF